MIDESRDRELEALAVQGGLSDERLQSIALTDTPPGWDGTATRLCIEELIATLRQVANALIDCRERANDYATALDHIATDTEGSILDIIDKRREQIAQLEADRHTLRNEVARLNVTEHRRIRALEALLPDPYGLICGMDGESAEWVEQGGAWVERVDAYQQKYHDGRAPAFPVDVSASGVRSGDGTRQEAERSSSNSAEVTTEPAPPPECETCINIIEHGIGGVCPECKPAPKKYAEPYECARCKAASVKLWRPSHTFANQVEMLCARCVAVETGESIETLDDDGRVICEMIGGQRTDNIGIWIPAVPTEDGETWWGYTSVPEDRVKWWRDLTTLTPDPAPKCIVVESMRDADDFETWIVAHRAVCSSPICKGESA